MKFAICISGFMRNFRETISSLKRNILDHLSCDIYLSTWNVVGNTYYKNSSPYQWKKPTEEMITNDIIEETYKPWLKEYKITPVEDFDSILPEWLKSCVASRRLAGMYFHIWQANELKKASGIDYPITIRYRPDLTLINNISGLLEKAATSYKNNPNHQPHVYIPHWECFHSYTNDQFMYGHTSKMDIIANIYSGS